MTMTKPKHDKPYFKPAERHPLIRLRPEPISDSDRLDAYEARRRAPLGGDKQVPWLPPSMRPVAAPAERRYPRELAKGGGVWWRLRMEALREKRARIAAALQKATA